MTEQRKNRILFIDDEAIKLSSLVEYFELEGFDVVTATDVESALRTLEVQQADLSAVVLDMIMPLGREVFDPTNTQGGYRTGIRLIQEIKAKIPDVPLVMFTVVHDPKAREQAFALGASAYVTKPIRPSELIRTVKEAIQNKTESRKRDK